MTRLAHLAVLVVLPACLAPVTEDGGSDAGSAVCGVPGASIPLFSKSIAGCVRLRSNLYSAASVKGPKLEGPSMETLRHIDGFLRLEFEDTLESLSGLDQLETLGELRLSKCSKLTRLDGFTGLRELRGLTIMSGNPGIRSLNGFAPLANFQGGLFIADSSVSSLQGLEHITSLASLYLANNPIRTLAPLAALRTIRGDLYLEGSSIPRSEIDAFLARVQVMGKTTILP